MLVRECYTETVDGKSVQKERWIEMPGVVDEAAGIVLMQAEQQKDANRLTIEQQADQALAANTAYLAIASPTNAQVAAQVKALTRQNNKIIRLLRGKFDGTD